MFYFYFLVYLKDDFRGDAVHDGHRQFAEPDLDQSCEGVGILGRRKLVLVDLVLGAGHLELITGHTEDAFLVQTIASKQRLSQFNQDFRDRVRYV